jgi:hypothetical protein
MRTLKTALTESSNLLTSPAFPPFALDSSGMASRPGKNTHRSLCSWIALLSVISDH